MCEINKPVNVIKACIEAGRKLILLGLKSNQVQVRDAETGHLLRSLTIGERYTIHSLALDGNVLHCGTNSNELITLDFMVCF